MSRWILAIVLSLLLPCAAFAAVAQATAAVAASAGDLAAEHQDAAGVHVDTDTSTDLDLFDAARDALPVPRAGSAPPRFRAAQLASPYLEVLGRPPRRLDRSC
jgi:hypothetical protein